MLFYALAFWICIFQEKFNMPLPSSDTSNAAADLISFDYGKLFSEETLDWLLQQSLLIALGIVLLIVGFFLTKYIISLLKKAMNRANLDPSLVSFLASAGSLGIKALVVVSVAAMMGVETSAFVAIIGAAGLAIGLALQGSLSNFAGGVLILIFKPFKVGDIIITNGQEGQVERIDILNTKIIAYDHQVIIAPNGDLANSMLINLSEKPLRRAEIPVRISYKSNLNAARKLMIEVFNEDPRIAKTPAPVVVMLQMEESYVSLSARAWCTMDDYFQVYWDCIEKIKNALEQSSEVDIPFPQQDVFLKNAPYEKVES